MIWVNNGVMWIAIGVIAVAAIVFRYMERSSRDATLRMLAEKGQPIPPELLHDGSYRGGSIRPGLILMGVGGGFALMFWGISDFGAFEGSRWLWTLGAIPFLIGIALFIAALFDRRPLAKND